ncbi:hypothetical protein D3C80_1020640 [compost metagenome]
MSSLAVLGQGEGQAHPRARQSLGVGQLQLAAVVFTDALDDGQAQPCALLARRDIGFGQPVTILGRQTHAIVFNSEGGDPAIHRQSGDDAGCTGCCRFAQPLGAYRLARIL